MRFVDLMYLMRNEKWLKLELFCQHHGGATGDYNFSRHSPNAAVVYEQGLMLSSL